MELTFCQTNCFKVNVLHYKYLFYVDLRVPRNPKHWEPMGSPWQHRKINHKTLFMRLLDVITCCKPDTWQLVNVVVHRFHINNWNKIRGKCKRTKQCRYTVQRCCLLLLRSTTTNSGCCIHRIFSSSLLISYQELRNGETNEVCIFLLSIYSVSNYWVSSLTFCHLVKTREICKYPIPIWALVVRRFGGRLQHFRENIIVMLQTVISLWGTQNS